MSGARYVGFLWVMLADSMEKAAGSNQCRPIDLALLVRSLRAAANVFPVKCSPDSGEKRTPYLN